MTKWQAPKTDQTPLVPTIVAIQNTGLVKVKFNRNLIIPSMYANVTLKRKEPGYIETIDYFLVLKVKSGIDDLNVNRTRIVKFNLTDFQKGYILLQVDFMHPEELSNSYS